jgi:hypothetical protein
VFAVKRLAVTLLVSALAAVAVLTTGAGGATSASKQSCETPVFQNGLELVFGRAKSRAAADRITATATRTGFKGVTTVQENCTTWKSVMRGIDSYDALVGVQAEARPVGLSPTLECLTAQEIGQVQVIFGTRASVSELGDVIRRAGNFGYVGLKTKRAPCGGYQAYIAGFRDRGQAIDYAKEASDRTGLRVFAIKA